MKNRLVKRIVALVLCLVMMITEMPLEGMKIEKVEAKDYISQTIDGIDMYELSPGFSMEIKNESKWFYFTPEEDGCYTLYTTDSDVYYIGLGFGTTTDLNMSTWVNPDFNVMLKKNITYYFCFNSYNDEIECTLKFDKYDEMFLSYDYESGNADYYNDETGDYTSAYIQPGETKTMKIKVLNPCEYGYDVQWDRNGSLIEGAKSEAYETDLSGSYICRVTPFDKEGNLNISDRLNINYDVYVENELEVHPVYSSKTSKNNKIDVSGDNGDNISLSVAVNAIDETGLTYKWYDENGIIENNNSYMDTVIDGKDTYTCEVIDRYGNSVRAYFYVKQNNSLVAYAKGTKDTFVSVKSNGVEEKTIEIEYDGIDVENVNISWRYCQRTESGTSYSTTGNEGTSFTAPADTDYCVATVSDAYGNEASVLFMFNYEIIDAEMGIIYDAGSKDKKVVLKYKPEKEAEYKIIWSFNCEILRFDKDSKWFYDAYNSWSGDGLYNRDYIYFSDDSDQYFIVSSYSSDGSQRREMGIAEETEGTYIECEGTVSVNNGEEQDNYNAYAKINDTATLKAHTTAENVSYSWYYLDENDNYQRIENETGSSLDVKVEGPATYRCAITDKNLNYNSIYYNIRIQNHLTAYVKGTEQTSKLIYAAPDSNTKLEVEAHADDEEGLTYEWTKNNDEIGGGDGSSITVDSENAGYRCRVEDKYGYNKTVDFTVCNLILKVNDRKTGDFSKSVWALFTPEKDAYYQFIIYGFDREWSGWIYIADEDWNGIGDSDQYSVKEDEKYLMINNVYLEKGKTYFCGFSSNAGTDDSIHDIEVVERNDNSFSVSPNEDMDGNTKDVYVNYGESAVLKPYVSAEDTAGITYSWYKQCDEGDIIIIQGTDKDSFTVENVKERADYYCIVKDKYRNRKYAYYNVHVENNLEAYAAGTKLKSVLVPVNASDTEVTLAVDASAKNTEGMIYKWDLGYREIDGEWKEVYDTTSGRSITLKSSFYEYYSYYSCTVIDKFGTEKEVSFRLVKDIKTMKVGDTFRMKTNEDKYEYWYSFTPSEDGIYRFYSNGKGEPSVNLYSEDGERIDWYNSWNDDENGKYFVMDRDLEKGKTYYYEVRSNYEDYDFTVSLINYESNNLNVSFENNHIYVEYGKEAVLKPTVKADDKTGLVYRWYKYDKETGDYELVEGGNTETLTVKVTENTRYQVQVRDRYMNREYATVYVYVENGFSVSLLKDTINVKPGDDVVVKPLIHVYDKSGLKCRWTCDGEVVSETEALELKNVQKNQWYDLSVVDKYGNSKSISVFVSVYTLEAEFEGIEKVTEYGWTRYTANVKPGEKFTLKVKVNEDAAKDLTYQWYKWEPEKGYIELTETGSSLTTEVVNEGLDYEVRINDNYGNTVYLYAYISCNNFSVTAKNNKTNLSVERGKTKEIEMTVKGDVLAGAMYSVRKYNANGTDGSGSETLEQDVAVPANGIIKYTTKAVNQAEWYEFKFVDTYGNTCWMSFRIDEFAVNVLPNEYLDDDYYYYGSNAVMLPENISSDIGVSFESSNKNKVYTFKWYADGTRGGVSYSDELIEGESKPTINTGTMKAGEHCLYTLQIYDEDELVWSTWFSVGSAIRTYYVNVDVFDASGNGKISVDGIADGYYAGNTPFTVSSQDTCFVFVTKDGGETFERLAASELSEGKYSYNLYVDCEMYVAIVKAGDFNLDGKVDSADALQILRYDVGKLTDVNILQILAGNVGGNDQLINSADALQVLRYDVGKTSFGW